MEVLPLIPLCASPRSCPANRMFVRHYRTIWRTRHGQITSLYLHALTEEHGPWFYPILISRRSQSRERISGPRSQEIRNVHGNESHAASTTRHKNAACCDNVARIVLLAVECRARQVHQVALRHRTRTCWGTAIMLGCIRNSGQLLFKS